MKDSRVNTCPVETEKLFGQSFNIVILAQSLKWSVEALITYVSVVYL